LGLIPRHPYSAVPLASNWELWRNLLMRRSNLASIGSR
jgi:hypothetical protein